MNFDNQSTFPITNTVRVLNGESFNDLTLKPRIAPLLNAHKISELLAALPESLNSLKVLGTQPTIEIRQLSKSNAHLLETIVDLRKTRPLHQFSLKTQALDDLFKVNFNYIYSNAFGLGEQIKVNTDVQPDPHHVLSGKVSLKVPMPTSKSSFNMATFFFSQNRQHASYDLATHGFTVFMETPLPQTTKFVLGTQMSDRAIHSINDKAGDLVRANAGNSNIKISLFSELKKLQQNSFFRLFGEFAGLSSSDAKHLKIESQVKLWRSFFNENLNANFMFNLGALLSKQPKLCDLFTLGGERDLIGFKQSAVRANMQPDTDYVGGSSYYTSRFTLLSKLPKVTSALRLKTQLDVGVLNYKADSDLQRTLSSLVKGKAAACTAFGVCYKTEKVSFDVLNVWQFGEGEKTGMFLVGAEMNFD